MLFTRCVSGTRVVPRGQKKSVGGVDFTGYGASVDVYPHDYLTAACAVGLSSAELDEFLVRLDKAIRKAKGERPGAAGALKAGPQGEEVFVGAGAAVDSANGSARRGASVARDTANEERQRTAVMEDVRRYSDESGCGGGVHASVDGKAQESMQVVDMEDADWDGVD